MLISALIIYNEDTFPLFHRSVINKSPTIIFAVERMDNFPDRKMFLTDSMQTMNETKSQCLSLGN